MKLLELCSRYKVENHRKQNFLIKKKILLRNGSMKTDFVTVNSHRVSGRLLQIGNTTIRKEENRIYLRRKDIICKSTQLSMSKLCL